MSGRVGQVWELRSARQPAEVILVIRNMRPQGLRPLYACLVLDGSPCPHGGSWDPGTIHNISDWDDGNGWRRVA